MTAPAPSEQVLGIVVVNYGSAALLERHLATIGASAVPASVVVVDNFSTVAERRRIEALCREQDWHFVPSAVNIGFGGACNLGAAVALDLGCDVLLMLNPDAVLTAEAAALLAQRCREHRDSLVSPVIHRSDGSVWFAGSRLDLRSGRVGRVPGTFRSGPDTWLTGACLATHADFWRRLGGFSGDYFLYWEDVDISRRCVDLGGSLLLATDIVAVHDAGGTQLPADGDGRAKSAVYYRYNCRNRLLFACRQLSTIQLLRWLVRTPTESAAVLLRGGRRQFVSSPGLLVAGLRGTLDGLALVVAEFGRRAYARVRSGAAARPVGRGRYDGSAAGHEDRTDAA